MPTSRFPHLQLPSIDAPIKSGPNDRPQIFDSQRRRFVTLTAEEWVRQHFVAYLIHHLHYPSALIGNEVSLIDDSRIQIARHHYHPTSLLSNPKLQLHAARPLSRGEQRAPTFLLPHGLYHLFRHLPSRNAKVGGDSAVKARETAVCYLRDGKKRFFRVIFLKFFRPQNNHILGLFSAFQKPFTRHSQKNLKRTKSPVYTTHFHHYTSTHILPIFASQMRCFEAFPMPIFSPSLKISVPLS